MLRIKNVIKGLSFSKFIILTFAGIINATGVTMFLAPLTIIDGGLSGTAYMLTYITHNFLSLSIFLLILNIPFYILSYKKLGINFIIYSIYGIGMYSLWAYLYQYIFFPSFLIIPEVTSSPIVGSDVILATIFGGLLSGIGSGLVIRCGGALDGCEASAVMFAKKLGITVGTFNFIYNVIQYIVFAIITTSWILPLYSILAYFIGSKTVDFINTGIDKEHGVFVVTKKDQEVASALSTMLGKGVTLIPAEGFYLSSQQKMIYLVVTRFEINKVKEEIYKIDNEAYISVVEITDSSKKNNLLNVFKRKKK